MDALNRTTQQFDGKRLTACRHRRSSADKLRDRQTTEQQTYTEMAKTV